MSCITNDASDFDSPPPYEQLVTTASTNTKTGTAILTEDEHHISNRTNPSSLRKAEWSYYQHPPNSNGFWIKAIRDAPSLRLPSPSELVQIHFGISRRREDTNGPDCFFTCNLLPRTSTTRVTEIANVCAKIARATRGHRGWAPNYCECTFRDLRDGVRCGKGGQWHYRLLYSTSAWKARRWMRQHDELCCCMCFDTHLPGSGSPL